MSGFLLLLVPFWMYAGIFHLSYFVWTFSLTQNWFFDNGLVIFKDIIYHHTPLPLFLLYFTSKILGNTALMLQISSFTLGLLFVHGVYVTAKTLSKKIALTALLFLLVTFFPLFQNFNLEEMTAAVFALYATYFFLKFWQKQANRWIFLSGLCIACALMGKQIIAGIIITLIIANAYSINNRKVGRQKLTRALFFFILGFAIGILPILIYYSLHHALADFFYWNIIFNLTIYRQQSTPYALKDGLLSSGWLLFSLVPAVFLWFRGKLNFIQRLGILTLICNTIFLFPSFLPSFLVYKSLPFFAYPLILWAIIAQYYRKKVFLVALVIGLIGLLPILKTFYIDYAPQDITNPHYIYDYGENEMAVTAWITKNTSKNEKIMNLGNHYITTLSKRLPANRYVYLFPWLVSPFDASTREIVSHPPKIVIIDWQTFKDFPTLNSWPFVKFVKQNYTTAAKYGTYEIFIFKK